MPTLFETYIDDLVQLHALIAQDKDECKRGDNLREYLVDNEKDLSGEDQLWVKNLSGDLYMIAGEDMYYKVTSDKKKAMKKELRENIKLKNWLEVLNILRASLGIPRHQIAAYRAMAWKEKSPQISVLFEKCAEVLKAKGE